LELTLGVDEQGKAYGKIVSPHPEFESMVDDVINKRIRFTEVDPAIAEEAIEVGGKFYAPAMDTPLRTIRFSLEHDLAIDPLAEKILNQYIKNELAWIDYDTYSGIHRFSQGVIEKSLLKLFKNAPDPDAALNMLKKFGYFDDATKQFISLSDILKNVGYDLNALAKKDFINGMKGVKMYSGVADDINTIADVKRILESAAPSLKDAFTDEALDIIWQLRFAEWNAAAPQQRLKLLNSVAENLNFIVRHEGGDINVFLKDILEWGSSSDKEIISRLAREGKIDPAVLGEAKVGIVGGVASIEVILEDPARKNELLDKLTERWYAYDNLRRKIIQDFTEGKINPEDAQKYQDMQIELDWETAQILSLKLALIGGPVNPTPQSILLAEAY
jgi:hypothetical protein